MQKPQISIVMPAFNSEETISASIESVLSQTFKNWELIIVDDASEDGTAKLVLREYDDKRIKLIQNSANMGPAGARNVALECATGDFVAFLDADDLWTPEKLKLQLSFMQNNNCAISFTSYWRLGKTDSQKHQEKKAAKVISYEDLLDQNGIGCLTAMIDRRKLPNLRFSNLSEIMGSVKTNRLLKFLLKGRVGHEDYAFWLSALRPLEGQPPLLALGLDEPLAYYRVSSGSFSANKFQAALSQWFIYRYIENLTFWRSLKHFSRYAFTGVYSRWRSRS